VAATVKVGITGSTGVVGQALIKLLVSQGYPTRALVRDAAGAEFVSRIGAQPVVGDLLDSDSLEELADGCEWVFNVAGVNELCVSDSSVMESVNVDGVKNVLEACRRKGVQRLIHTSSAVTLGEEHGSVGREDSKHRGSFLSEYERTKYLGEQALFSAPGIVEVVAVNPSSVQGPGRATGTGKIILGVVRGEMKYLVDSPVSLVDIDDCATGHLLAARVGVSGERYVLNGSTLSVREAVSMASAAAGRNIRLRFIPKPVVRVLAAVAGPAARLVGKKLPFCSEMIRVMTFGHQYDGSKAAEELGLIYTPIELTIERTIQWFDSEGLLAGN
jgi:dihydroflavonol-4-reductase